MFSLHQVAAFLLLLVLCVSPGGAEELLTRVPLAVEAPRTARLGVEWKF